MLYFVTGNKHKIRSAKFYLSEHNISFTAKDLPLIEIQSTSIEDIAVHKAKSAYEKLRQPLIVKDDGWEIAALHGFPGPYMRYMNQWFTTDDFVQLLRNKTNRTVIFHEVICYIDNQQLKLFTDKIRGEILDKPRGSAVPFMELCTFRKDKKTMADANQQGLPEFDKRTAWTEFAKWYITSR